MLDLELDASSYNIAVAGVELEGTVAIAAVSEREEDIYDMWVNLVSGVAI